MSSSFEIKIQSTPHVRYALNNRVYFGGDFFKTLVKTAHSDIKLSASDPTINIAIGPFVFLARSENEDKQISLSF